MSKDETLNNAIATHHKIVETERCKIIDVERPQLWKTALMLYKSGRKDELLSKLNVMFEGYEDAVDAGALGLEFFGDLMREELINVCCVRMSVWAGDSCDSINDRRLSVRHSKHLQREAQFEQHSCLLRPQGESASK